MVISLEKILTFSSNLGFNFYSISKKILWRLLLFLFAFSMVSVSISTQKINYNSLLISTSGISAIQTTLACQSAWVEGGVTSGRPSCMSTEQNLPFDDQLAIWTNTQTTIHMGSLFYEPGSQIANLPLSPMLFNP